IATAAAARSNRDPRHIALGRPRTARRHRSHTYAPGAACATKGLPGGRKRIVAAALADVHAPCPTPVREGVKAGYPVHSNERERFHHHIREAGILHGPGRTTVNRDEDAEISSDVESSRVAGINDNAVDWNVWKPGCAGTVNAGPGGPR